MRHSGSTSGPSASLLSPPRKERATEKSASSGHALNQSIVQQLTSAGNMRQRLRKAAPMGDMASTMCTWSRTLLT